MCGIFGLADYHKNGVNTWDYDLFFEMMYAGALRGMHGTGALAVDKKGNSITSKIGGPPHQLVNTPQYMDLERFVKDRDTRFLLGHNRYATRGKRVTAHTHPFRHGKIILVHNGTLDSYKHYPDHPEFGKFDVDSEHMAYSIDKIGIDATISETLGAWAIVYFDRTEKTLNILRNDQRPLHIAYDDDTVVWASEKEMLQWILARNHFYHLMDKVVPVPTDTLFTFGLDDPKPTTREVKGRPFPKKSDAEMRKVYCEVFGESIIDVTGTTEEVEKVVDITPTVRNQYPIVPSSAASRAPTGKVLAPKPAKKGGNNHVPVQHIHDLSRGGLIECDLYNYDSLAGSKEPKTFMMMFTNDVYPDIEFVTYVAGQQKVDEIVATCKIIGKIANILKSQESTAITPHRVYLHEILPVLELEEPKEIPDHAKVA